MPAAEDNIKAMGFNPFSRVVCHLVETAVSVFHCNFTVSRKTETIASFIETSQDTVLACRLRGFEMIGSYVVIIKILVTGLTFFRTNKHDSSWIRGSFRFARAADK